MQTRLASWKNRLLNRTGRLALATYVLSSIPSYYMQINWLPQNICDSIDQTTQNFICRGSNNKGIHLLNWKKVTAPKSLGGLGIRTARNANTYLLGKLVWDMVQSTDKLWVNLLSTKYTVGSCILHANATSNSSPSWASIIRAKNVLKNEYPWRAGSGTSSFWFSNWCSNGFLGSLVPIIDIYDIQLTVRDVISFTGQHTQALYTTLPPPVADTVNNFHTNFNSTVEDAFIWRHNKNGVYSTKSGYTWLLSLMEPTIVITMHHSWSWIWNLQVSEKYKFFIWLACHNAVPTLSLLHHRHITTSATCGRCNEEEETFMHCVRDCRVSCVIWQKFGFTSQDFFANNCAHDWIKSGSKGPRPAIFFASLWWLWRHRNQTCFNNDTWSITRICINIQNSTDIIEKSFQPDNGIAHSNRMVRWNNSNHQCHVLNVDGSCLGTPIWAGFGGLIRKSVGFFLLGFFGYLPNTNCILLAELTTMLKGLQLAFDMGLEVWFATRTLSSPLILSLAMFPNTTPMMCLFKISKMLWLQAISLSNTLSERVINVLTTWPS